MRNTTKRLLDAQYRKIFWSTIDAYHRFYESLGSTQVINYQPVLCGTSGKQYGNHELGMKGVCFCSDVYKTIKDHVPEQDWPLTKRMLLDRMPDDEYQSTAFVKLQIVLGRAFRARAIYPLTSYSEVKQ